MNVSRSAFAVLFALSALAGTTAALNATPSGVSTFLAGAMRISQYTYYEPYPIEPGGNFDLWVRIDNPSKAGDNPVIGAECAIDSRYPFSSADPRDDLTRNIGTLQATQQVLLKFKLHADENAVEGDNDISIRCRVSGGVWQTKDLGVYVKTRDPVLAIYDVSSTPAEIMPGMSGTITFGLENKGNSAISNIVLKMDLSSASLPIAPANSSGEESIQKISPKGTANVSLSVLVPPSTPPGVYKIPVNLTYDDSLGDAYSRSATASVSVYAPAEVRVTVDSSDVLKPNNKGQVVLAVTNKGLSDIKRLSASIGTGDGYTLLSAPEIYLGDIDSNDFQTVEIEAFVNTTGSQIRIPVHTEFRDAFNRLHTQDDVATARVYTQEEAVSLQLESAGGSMLPIVVGIIVLAAAYVAYRRYSKRHKAA